ncbi:hypothetical protein LIER_19437 [Lithospermum erythrorhizon]|uniref:Uncharacterized protein n=1 Tax=Lithospermum erythrorhizon TaxID=34254 RepID=A0AAV3QKD3_LITER
MPIRLWAGNAKDRKRTSSGCFLLGNNLVSWELIEDKVITLKHVSTEKQLVDIFTKTLDATQFESLKSSLGLCVIDK